MKSKKNMVYMHVVPNGKIYIGMTSLTLKRRSGRNGIGYSGQLHFYKDIKKYGWNNIEHKIIYENLNREEAIEIESWLISLFNTTDPEKGYNRDDGRHSS